MHGSFKSGRLGNLFRLHGIGPGGWKCNCCAPAPKLRHAWCKAAKKRLKAFVEKDIQDQLYE